MQLQTAFLIIELKEIIGEGGSGVVYSASTDDGPVAVKILTKDKATTTKRRRFKNETRFLSGVNHQNIVPVIDSGFSTVKPEGPFYVMPLYTGNLRDRMQKGIEPKDVISWFAHMLDGVEAAHLKKVVHRDLKPENFLCNGNPESVAVSDFGIASFTSEDLWTAVETKATERLANFAYAAPEQRDRRADVGVPADIFALGLILNEMFTGEVPYGANYKTISSVSKEHEYLDRTVGEMLQRDPSSRPPSIAHVKARIKSYEEEAISYQKLDRLRNVVIPEGENEDPLAHEPPRIVDVDWASGQLTITFDQNISHGWVDGLLNMGSFRSSYGHPPNSFHFTGNVARKATSADDVQAIVDYFKEWLPKATQSYRERWKREQEQRQREEQRRLKIEREAEERRLKLKRDLKF